MHEQDTNKNWMDPEQYKEETKRNDKIMRAYERLLDYVKVYTTSEDGQEQIPSTMRQFDLARQLAEELKGDESPKLTVGDGAQLCCDYLNGHGIPCRLAPESSRYQSAVGVALAAEAMARRGEAVSGRELVPTYLRLSQAERERLAKGMKIRVN